VFAEPGSDVAAELWERADSVVASQLIYPEARAAVAAAKRMGRIDARSLRAAVREIDDLYGALHVIGVDEPLAKLAGQMAEEHALRGYDAVHLASAIAVDEPRLVMATWDGDLAAAALACGYSVVSRD